jgi:hypothetical protein
MPKGWFFFLRWIYVITISIDVAELFSSLVIIFFLIWFETHKWGGVKCASMERFPKYSSKEARKS